MMTARSIEVTGPESMLFGTSRLPTKPIEYRKATRKMM